jgi:hypothetical protein
MATTKKNAAAAADAAPDTVYLRSEELGETRPFTPAHANALLAWQEGKGYTHWQRVEAPAPEADAA